MEAAAIADGEAGVELPEWRLELSRRLQEIRAKRDFANGATVEIPVVPAAAAAGAVVGAETSKPAQQERAPVPVKANIPRRHRRAARIEPLELKPEQDKAAPGDVPQVQPAVPDVEIPMRVPAAASDPEPAADVLIRPAIPGPTTAAGRGIQSLTEAVRASQSAEYRPHALEREEVPAPIFAASGPNPRDERREEKLILLTRTLAGLVDLIMVVVCACTFVFAVDVIEGITLLDSVSLLHYTLLLLATYFVYSLFFLSTGRQTIGMMLTDLRVVRAPVGPPTLGQLLLRCCVFPIGLAAAGIGLVWGCFDHQSRCLHDLVSGTRVERINL